MFMRMYIQLYAPCNVKGCNNKNDKIKIKYYKISIKLMKTNLKYFNSVKKKEQQQNKPAV